MAVHDLDIRACSRLFPVGFKDDKSGGGPHKGPYIANIATQVSRSIRVYDMGRTRLGLVVASEPVQSRRLVIVTNDSDAMPPNPNITASPHCCRENLLVRDILPVDRFSPGMRSAMKRVHCLHKILRLPSLGI